MLEVFVSSILGMFFFIVIITSLGLMIGYGIDFSVFMWLRYGKTYAVWYDLRPRYNHDKMTELLDVYQKMTDLPRRIHCGFVNMENPQYKEKISELIARKETLEKELFGG